MAEQLEFSFSDRYNEIIKHSIEMIKEFEPEDGYFLAFSGGKDSIVLLDLAKRAGVKFEAHYHPTTVDPKELVMFVKSCEGVIIDKPRTNMWKLILQNGMPPTRRMRYCCRELKESYGENRRVLTGIRSAESSRRANTRKEIELCSIYNKQTINPIFRWKTVEIWRYIRENGLKYCRLYDEGFDRIGCVLCPMNTNRVEEAKRFPGLVKVYKLTFEKLVLQRKSRGQKCSWATGAEMFNWWLSDRSQNKDIMSEPDTLFNHEVK